MDSGQFFTFENSKDILQNGQISCHVKLIYVISSVKSRQSQYGADSQLACGSSHYSGTVKKNQAHFLKWCIQRSCSIDSDFQQNEISLYIVYVLEPVDCAYFINAKLFWGENMRIIKQPAKPSSGSCTFANRNLPTVSCYEVSRP